MNKLSKSDLMSLEQYAVARADYRAQVIEHKKNRRVAVGPNASLYFEDRFTMQYQVQEILRLEKMFEAEQIDEELAAYNPLIPDGSNWKATFMLEYADESERRHALARLIGIEKTVWVQIAAHAKVYAIANEDLERETEEKTAAVHFLRFELDSEMRAAAKKGSDIQMGIEHRGYQYDSGVLPRNIAGSLIDDLSYAQ